LSPTGSNFSHVISVGKYLQKWNGIVHLSEVWVEVEGVAKFVPYVPCCDVGILAVARDALGGNILNNAEFSGDSSSGMNGAILQEGCTGKVMFM
jgi:hypothetical protein